MISPKTLSEPEALEATKLLAFEMYNFRLLVRIYRSGNMLNLGLWRLVTSQTLLLHTRVIWYFFYEEPKRKEDIVLGNFTGMTWKGESFTFPTKLMSPPADLPGHKVKRTDIKIALDRRLVHFGRGRFEHDENGKKQYHPGLEDYDQHFDELEERIIKFRKGLPGSLRSAFDDRHEQFADRDKRIVVPLKAAPKLVW